MEHGHKGDEPDGHHHDERLQLIVFFCVLAREGKAVREKEKERERRSIFFPCLSSAIVVVVVVKAGKKKWKTKALTGDILIPGESSV